MHEDNDKTVIFPPSCFGPSVLYRLLISLTSFELGRIEAGGDLIVTSVENTHTHLFPKSVSISFSA
eukprot:UN27313